METTNKYGMRAMIGALLMALALAVFFGNLKPPSMTPKEHTSDPSFDKAVAAVLTLNSAARDPESLVIESTFVTEETDAVCLEFRARNGFGGMSRGKAVLTKDKFRTNDDPGFASLWNKACANQTGKEYADLMKYVLREVHR